MNQETRTILENNNFVVLSTADESGQPWGTPVHFAFDEENIYWISGDAAVHSQNVFVNDKIFLVIFNSQQDVTKGTRAAVYIETTARVLQGEEAKRAHDDVYAKRFPSSHLPEGDGAHIFAASIGTLNEAKTKDTMMYYRQEKHEGVSTGRRFSDLNQKAIAIRDHYNELAVARGFKQWNTQDRMAGFVADVGELSEYIMAKHGLRSGPKDQTIDEALTHELCDCLWSVLVIAKELDIDLEAAFTKWLDHMHARIEREKTETK